MENENWFSIGFVDPDKGKTLLIFSPRLRDDDDFPGHAIQVSNAEYVLCGNAKRQGYTHWTYAPKEPA